MSTEPTNTLLPKLDEETRRLLDARLDWDLRLYAKACEQQIRHDYEHATRQARAKGISPKNAVGKKLDPQLLWANSNPPYLKRTEEDWLKTFRPDAQVSKTPMRKQLIGFAIFISFMAVLDFSAHQWSTGPWYVPWIELAVNAIFFGLIFVAGPWLVLNVVKLFGPYGCAWVSPWVALGAVLFVFPIIMFDVELFSRQLDGFLLFYLVLMNVGLAIIAVQYLRARNRIKQHYETVCKILELPGWTEEE